MKVTLEKDYRRHYTLDDLDRAKTVIAWCKDTDETATYWAEYAVREALKECGGVLETVLSAEAHTAKNDRARNEYGDDTENMDVWIRFKATFTGGKKYRDYGYKVMDGGYIEGGAYLTDIWQTGGRDYTSDMYFRIAFFE